MEALNDPNLKRHNYPLFEETVYLNNVIFDPRCRISTYSIIDVSVLIYHYKIYKVLDENDFDIKRRDCFYIEYHFIYYINIASKIK